MAERLADHRLAASSLARVLEHATLGASLPGGAGEALSALPKVRLTLLREGGLDG